MTRFKKIILFSLLFLFLGAFVPFVSFAQPPNPDCDPLDPACPIDGGVSLLILAGIGLGAKKVLSNPEEQ